MSQHLARIREERPAFRVVHRKQDLRRRNVRPGNGGQRAGDRSRNRVGIAVAPAIVDAVEGEALGVEQDRRAAEIEPVAEGLCELAASDALAAQDSEHVRLQELELLRVRILLQELLELFRYALGRLAHEAFPAGARASPGDGRLGAVPSQYFVELARLRGFRRLDRDVDLERIPHGLAHAADVEAAVDCLLGHADCIGIVGGDALRERERLVEQARRRHDAIDQAHRLDFGRRSRGPRR